MLRKIYFLNGRVGGLVCLYMVWDKIQKTVLALFVFGVGDLAAEGEMLSGKFLFLAQNK